MVYSSWSLQNSDIEIIAEVGINHNGSLDLAKRHVEEAAKSGATTVKFQTYRTSERVSSSHSLHKVLKECELELEDFEALASTCEDWGVRFLSTAFGLSSLQTLVDLNQQRCKIASFSLVDEVLIRAALKSNMSLIISTGASSLDEILETNSWLPIEDTSHVFLHCISEYPVRSESELNLINIPLIRELTSRHVGFSDHSLGSESFLFAALAGARVFEKHFTVDRALPGPDQEMSADPDLFSECVASIERGLEILGNPRDNPFDGELPIQAFRTNLTSSQ